MPRFFRKLLSIRSAFRKTAVIPGEIAEENWTADFSKVKTCHFDIKSESSYDANLQKFGARHCLSLGLKKTGCIAWVEAPDYRYRDQVINARIRLDPRGGYAAAGIMFRMVDGETYYSFLISSKGYFRLDLFRNGMPQPLIAWTELPDRAAAEMAAEHVADFTITAYGSHILILIKNQWAAEINDTSILEGCVAFAAASYENTGETVDDGRFSAMLFSPLPVNASLYTAETFLESLTIDSRIDEASALYEKWSDSPDIDPRCRFRLAETFTAMNQHRAGLSEITKAWEIPGCKQEQKELLLAGRLALQLGMTTDAERYISACFEKNVDSPEGKEAVTEMAKILCAAERYAELKAYCKEAVKIKPGDPILKAFQGHAYWNLKEYKAASDAYDEAFALDRKNGLLAKNAANVYEVLGKKKEALARYLEAGRVFLAADNYGDLGLVVPKILALGEDDRDARALAGKWAFGIEDWDMAEKEFEKAETIRKKKRLPKDAALAYLRALLLIRGGKRSEALPLLEEAADLEKDYALFRFKLAENRYLLNKDPADKKLLEDLDRAAALSPGDGWINNFAAQLCLERGEFEAAAVCLEKAAALLGEVPAIKVNRAELLSRQGKIDEAVAALAPDNAGDPGGVMANCAGNLLVKAGRFEEADEKYRAALEAGENNEYLFNHASCLIELGSYGEADNILAKLHKAAPNPDLLELISYVAVKKGEYLRAETACRSALEMNPNHVPSLLSLGWMLASASRFDEGEKILSLLDRPDLSREELTRRDELRAHYDRLRYTGIKCASCGRSWKVLKDSPPVQGMRILAMPPDELPAGSCPECGKTFCIGCAKEHLDASGRFICSECGKSLRFTNDGLKKIIYDWTVEYGIVKKRKSQKTENTNKKTGEKSGGGPVKKTKVAAQPGAEETSPRGRGRPKKIREDLSPEPKLKNGRGRPKGSKNKGVPEKNPAEETSKRKQGRPGKAF